jgi:hypothetical protein
MDLDETGICRKQLFQCPASLLLNEFRKTADHDGDLVLSHELPKTHRRSGKTVDKKGGKAAYYAKFCQILA